MPKPPIGDLPTKATKKSLSCPDGSAHEEKFGYFKAGLVGAGIFGGGKIPLDRIFA